MVTLREADVPRDLAGALRPIRDEAPLAHSPGSDPRSDVDTPHVFEDWPYTEISEGIQIWP